MTSPSGLVEIWGEEREIELIDRFGLMDQSFKRKCALRGSESLGKCIHLMELFIRIARRAIFPFI